MTKKRNIPVSIITQTVVSVAALALATGVFIALVKTKPTAQVSNDPPVVRQVETMHAIEVPVRRQWTGFGTAAAMDSANVPAQVAAVVVRVPRHIVAGAEINQGDVIAELEKSDHLQRAAIITQQIAEIDAQLAQLQFEQNSWSQRVELAAEETELARRELQRVLNAYERDGAKQREVDRVEDALKVKQRAETIAREELDKISPRRAGLKARQLGLEAESMLAKKNIERCTIRSPLTGMIQTVDIEAGEQVVIGQRVARVVNLRRIEVPLRLPADARATVSVGDEAVITSQGHTVQTWSGQIRRISPQDDETTRTLAAFVEVEQDPHATGLLAPGKFVLGRVLSSTTELRSVVPRRSLLEDHLLLIEDNIVHSVQVHVEFHVQGEFPQLGVTAEQWAVLAEALPRDALVVVNATRSLPEGLEVKPITLNSKAIGEATARTDRGTIR